MVVSVSFQKRIPPGSVNGRGSLAELMARQKAYADSRGAVMQEETPTIMQGLGKVANVMANAWGERQAMNDEAAGRERLAAIRAGIDLDKGPTSEQIGEAGVLDEDYARQLQEQALQLRRDAATNAITRHGQDITEQGDIRSDATQRHGQDITEKGNIMSDATQRAGQVITQQGNEMSDATQRAGQTITKEGNQLQADVTTAGQKVTAAGNQLSADVQREGFGSAEKIADAKAKADLANDPSFEPATPADIVQFNLKPAMDKGASFKIKIVNGQREPIQIGSPPQDTTLPGEAAAKLGYMTDFLAKFPDLEKRVAAGAVSGVLNTAKVKSGFPSEATNILREIQTGSEALVRGLTGMGMPASEAATYADRYQPSWWSALGPGESITKLHELNEDMWNVYNAASADHRWSPDPVVFGLKLARDRDREKAAAANGGTAPAGGGPAPAQNFPERPLTDWSEEELKLGRQTH